MPDTAYKLYELTPVQGSTDNMFSPFVWRTKTDLALLGVPYETVPYTFSQIRGELAKATGNEDVTVPTLQVGETYVTDSVNVAEYLDAQHPGTLFPTPTARLLSYFLDQWVDREFAPVAAKLFRSLFYLNMDEGNRAYFLAVKNGDPAKSRSVVLNGIKAIRDPKQAKELAREALVKLTTFDRLLAKSGGPFVLGEHPSHCDSAIFGWYVTSQINPEINSLLWRNEAVPHVKAWSEAMEKAIKFKSPFTVDDKQKKEELVKELEATA